MTNQYIVIVFAVVGLIIGYFILILSNHFISKKSKGKDYEERSAFLNNLIDKRLLRYMVSLANGLVWAFIAINEKNPIIAVLLSIIISLGILISIIDIRIRIIPNELVLALLFGGLIYQLTRFGWISALIALGCMLTIMILFIVLGSVMGLEKIGAGDVKLAGAMGLVLGYPNIFVGILGMSCMIIIYCFLGFSLYRISLKSMFAYAPFMMAGMTIAVAVSLLEINLFGRAFF